jgi:uncharacterized protein YecE (DUF72 family)
MTMPITIGIAGWAAKDWDGVVYPRGEKDWLAYVARHFDHVEISSTFHSAPSEHAAGLWALSVADNPRFTFSARAWRRFTHETDRAYSKEDVRTFRESLMPLVDSGRLVCLLFQFPHQFRDSPEHRSHLKRLADDFRDCARLVVELRSASWQRPELMLGLGKLGFSVAVFDMPMTIESFAWKTVVTGPLAYARLHGRNAEAWFNRTSTEEEKYNYTYTMAELKEILERAKALAATSEAQAVYLIANNHFAGQGAANALQLNFLLTGKPQVVPSPLLAKHPWLEEIATAEEGELFPL